MLYIRTDMNSIIATGHVMRCLAIADAAKIQGEQTTFILADEQAVELLANRGYPYIILHTKWDCMEEELSLLEKIIREYQIRSLLIDSYQVTYSYLKRLSLHVKTYYMDDLNRFIYPVHGLICYAINGDTFRYHENYPNTKLYLGTQYTPLRKEFSGCSEKIIKPEAQNLLLMSGGSDPFGFLAKMLEKLDIRSYRRIDVICGVYHTNYQELRQKYAAFSQIHIQKSVSDMQNYIDRADLAVSAGGTTLYELCAFGTPAISYTIADNQVGNAEVFQKQGIIDYAGDIRNDMGAVIRYMHRQLARYRDNSDLRTKRSRKMQKLVDGSGAARIAQALRESGEPPVLRK